MKIIILLAVLATLQCPSTRAQSVSCVLQDSAYAANGVLCSTVTHRLCLTRTDTTYVADSTMQAHIMLIDGKDGAPALKRWRKYQRRILVLRYECQDCGNEYVRLAVKYK